LCPLVGIEAQTLGCVLPTAKMCHPHVVFSGWLCSGLGEDDEAHADSRQMAADGLEQTEATAKGLLDTAKMYIAVLPCFVHSIRSSASLQPTDPH
jgi:hypothetical protein